MSIEAFDFKADDILRGKYAVVTKLGGGWEGEVYIVQELMTGIERAAKFFYPSRNKNNRAAKFYAKKLHALRNCSILIQYLTQETLDYEGQEVTFLISEFVEGETLESFLKKSRGRRLSPFEAVHLLYALAKGIEEIHRHREYHGDLHTGNVIIRQFGLHFDLKLIDMFHWGDASIENMREDVINLIHIFHESLGGRKHYSSQPEEVKNIVCGLKRSLILKKFRTARHLREHLENFEWSHS